MSYFTHLEKTIIYNHKKHSWRYENTIAQVILQNDNGNFDKIFSLTINHEGHHSYV